MGNILLFMILATNVLRSGSTDANRSVLQNLFRSTEKDSKSTHLKHPIRNESSRGRSPQELGALRKQLLSILNQIERDLHLRGNGNVWLRHGGHGQAVDREYQMNELQHFRDNILAAPTIKSLKKIKAKLPTLEVLSEDEKIDAIALKSEWVNVLEDAQMELVRVDKCRKVMKKFDEIQIVNEIVKIAKWFE
uniref:Secreted RxLR effector peptide protein n=1 Tax=Globodera pallida TaxID=36090 RepID=A0A183CGN8_GLOPA